MHDHDVVIAGGGPTGLVLAAELALAGVDVAVVERRPDQSVDGSRAGGLFPRTLEVLAQRGVADRFVEAGVQHPVLGYAGTMLDVSDQPTRHPYVLGLVQREIEPLLAAWVEELPVTLLRSRDVVGFTEDDDGVAVAVSDGSTLRAGWLVGCDGGRSLVRREAGIDFPGLDPTTSWIIAEAELRDPPTPGMHHDELGSHGVGPTGDAGVFRMVLTERELHRDSADLDQLRAALTDVFGTDLGVHAPRWISRFTDATRQAAAYRRGRVLLAGDTAHVHPPHGGQGLNTGVQDAVNLGWKLAQVVHGTSGDDLLDTYHDERHAVGARVQDAVMAHVAMARPDARSRALRDAVAELVVLDEPRRLVVARQTGLDVTYPLGDGHPLVGRRVPDLDLGTADGPTHVFALLHAARPLLLVLDGSGPPDPVPSSGRVRVVEATCDTPWELPAVGEVDAPVAVLVRPDGHVAWAGEPDDPALAEVARRWFGV